MAPKNRIELATSLILDLQATHKLKEVSIHPLQREGLLQHTAEIEILKYIAACPDSTAYSISSKNVVKMVKMKARDGKYRDTDERWIRKQILKFAEIGLIERTQKAPSQHNAKPCRLSIAGLVYLIQRREIMENNVIRGILKYYSNNALFQLLVYPYIKQDTIQRLTSFNSLSSLFSFLYDCCKELDDPVRVTNTTKNQYVTEGYLVWQSIPDDNRQSNRLLEFLKREFNLEWVDRAKVEKIGDGNSLKIFYKSKFVFIRLDDTRTKAIVTMKGKTIFEFSVKNNSVMEVPSKVNTHESAANFLIGYVQNRVPSFIFNLMLSVTTDSEDFRILSEDETFLNTVERTKTKFMSSCELLALKRSAALS